MNDGAVIQVLVTVFACGAVYNRLQNLERTVRKWEDYITDLIRLRAELDELKERINEKTN